MLLGSKHWHTGYRLFLAPDGTEGGSLDVPADDADIDAIADLGDAGKAAMKKERQARREAAKSAKEAADTLKAVQAQVDSLNRDKQKRDADAATQAEKDREAKGEFETLAKDRERERDQAKADLGELQTKYDKLRDVATTVVKTDYDALPEEVRDVYPGEADDPVAILEFLPKAKKLVEKMAGGEQNNSQGVNGATPPPKPSGPAGEDAKAADVAAQRQNQNRYA